MEEQKDGESKQNARTLSQGTLDRYLLIIVSTLMTALALILIGHLWFQLQNYRRGIELSLMPGDPLGHSALITYARALDFTVVKTTSVFMGFMLVFVGALYLLRVAEAAYSLGLQSGESKASLQTTSPGLVLATLGVACAIFALYEKSTITLEQSPVMKGVPTPTIEVQPPGSQPSSKKDSPQSQSNPSARDTESPPSLSFAPKATTLSNVELSKVESLCQYLRNHSGGSVTVEVFGDPGESDEYNLGLADRRKDYVQHLLSEKCSAPPQIRTTSQGKERPGGETRRGQVNLRVDK
jgi:outer membrane protein OmpA-like peptidoglycan-associated protein